MISNLFDQIEISNQMSISSKDLLSDSFWYNNLKIGGSRYMNANYPSIIQINESTDWDFYIQKNTENESRISELQKSGAVGKVEKSIAENSPLYPYDNLTDSIYLGSDFQLVVRTDADKYSKVMSRLDPNFYRDFIWKSGPNKPSRDSIMRIMNQLFEMIG